MKYLVVVFVLVVGLTTPLAANETTTVQVNGQIFKLTAPQGFCFLDERVDRVLIEAIRSPTPKPALQIANFSECNNLRKFRTDRADQVPLDAPMGVYSIILDTKKIYIRRSRSAYLQRLVRVFGKTDQYQFERILANVLGELADRNNLSSLGIKLGQPVSLGLLGSDRNAVYLGAILNLSDGGVPIIFASVVAQTILNGTRVGLTLGDKYRNVDTIHNLLATAKDLARRIVISNGN